MNLSQTVGFQPEAPNQQLQVMPAIFSSKFLIDGERLGVRFVHPLELMAAQSLPVLHPKELSHLQSQNFEDVLAKANIGLHSLASLAGNGMRVSSVGRVLFFALCNIMSAC